MEQLHKLQAKYGMELLGPPIFPAPASNQIRDDAQTFVICGQPLCERQKCS